MKLRRYPQDDTQPLQGFFFYCPGCQHAHLMRLKGGPGAPTWQWNQSRALPVFYPSIVHFHGGWKRPDGTEVPRVNSCHLFVGGNPPHFTANVVSGDRPGWIWFLEDCAEHQLRGWHELPDFPPDYMTP
jgi:hypothetical protein